MFNPDIFQGKGFRKNYFEGWYFKLIDKNKEFPLAIIPGVSYNKSESHSFIQILYGNTGKTDYHKFNIDDFNYSNKKFEVAINDNYFSDSYLKINIENYIVGELEFRNIIKYPKKWFSPGIMGPFSFIPFMECYHGVVNIHNNISGELKINDVIRKYEKGYGYVEKDWGSSFPRSWIWIQTNHFDKDNVYFMFSIADIPIFGLNFVGLICYIMIEGRFYLFSTYNNSRIKSIIINKNNLKTIIKSRNNFLEIEAENSISGTLKGPKNGLMNLDVSESIDAKVKIRLFNKNKDLIFEGIGINTGMEFGGDIESLIKKQKISI